MEVDFHTVVDQIYSPYQLVHTDQIVVCLAHVVLVGSCYEVDVHENESESDDDEDDEGGESDDR